MKRKAGLPEPFSSYASFTPLCSMVGMGVSSLKGAATLIGRGRESARTPAPSRGILNSRDGTREPVRRGGDRRRPRRLPRRHRARPARPERAPAGARSLSPLPHRRVAAAVDQRGAGGPRGARRGGQGRLRGEVGRQLLGDRRDPRRLRGFHRRGRDPGAADLPGPAGRVRRGAAPPRRALRGHRARGAPRGRRGLRSGRGHPALHRARRAGRLEADHSGPARAMAGDRWVAVGDAPAFLDPIFSTGVLLAMQGGLEAAEAIDAGLRAGDLSARRFEGYEGVVRRRYHYFRRFVVGFYDPYFRRLLFRRSRQLGIYEAVLSPLARNWRPTLGTRLRIQLFFAIVAVKRFFPVAPPGDPAWRLGPAALPSEGARAPRR